MPWLKSSVRLIEDSKRLKKIKNYYPLWVLAKDNEKCYVCKELVTTKWIVWNQEKKEWSCRPCLSKSKNIDDRFRKFKTVKHRQRK